MENHGTAFKSRWKLLRERVEAIKALWTKEEASYHGEFVNFDPVWCWPKPVQVQKPHPSILLGSQGQRGMQRVVRYCDGWLPNAGRGVDFCPPRLRSFGESPKRPVAIRRQFPLPRSPLLQSARH
jgi:alkanesulfonate monooxygenase SsuD/methylene tetrahydromethanopterin reductase-like flavin-dependent oxidoreductase (luciferase family)